MSLVITKLYLLKFSSLAFDFSSRTKIFYFTVHEAKILESSHCVANKHCRENGTFRQAIFNTLILFDVDNNHIHLLIFVLVFTARWT